LLLQPTDPSLDVLGFDGQVGGFGLLDPVAQRFLVHTGLLGDASDGTVSSLGVAADFEGQSGGSVAYFCGILRGRHGVEGSPFLGSRTPSIKPRTNQMRGSTPAFRMNSIDLSRLGGRSIRIADSWATSLNEIDFLLHRGCSAGSMIFKIASVMS